MTSGSSTMRAMRLTVALILFAPAALAAATDAQALLERLARPAPAAVAFTEVRISPLLREPLIVSGELQYLGHAHLQRRVLDPYTEVTAIRDESVIVEREGERPRSFSLKRAPELRGLLGGFTALLSGDAASLERDFTVETRGEDAAWQIMLTPRDSRVRRRLERIEIFGRDEEAQCLALLHAGEGASVMLLGAATLPEQLSVAKLLEHCAQLQPPAASHP